MPNIKLARIKAGDYIDESAPVINAGTDTLMRQRIIQGAGIHVTDTESGQSISAVASIEFVAKITAAGSKGSDGTFSYAYQSQISQSTGTWVDGDYVGTVASNPAYELNGNPLVPTNGNTRVIMRYDVGSDKFFFSYSKCAC